MKKCSICKLKKSVNCFGSHANKKDGLQSACKDCNRERSRAYYKKNKIKHRQKVAEGRAKAIARARAFSINYLKENPCIDCGENDLVVLEFDHRKPKLKIMTVSKAVNNGWSVGKLKIEIEKCDVRCANCHRRKTAFQFNWYTAGV